MSNPRLSAVVAALEAIAPLDLAEPWDNVGLLVEARGRTVRRCLLTIDLTPEVMEEAIATRTDLIVSYHPPIFAPLKRLRAGRPKERIVLDAVAKGISIYSPHTALDAVPGGVNDWLASAFGKGETASLAPQAHRPDGEAYKVVTFVPETHIDRLRAALSAAGAGVIGDYVDCSFNLSGEGTFRGLKGTKPAVGKSGGLERVPEIRMEMVSPAGALPRVREALLANHPYEEPAWELYELAARPSRTTGQGRSVDLARPLTLDAAVKRLKKHLGLAKVRVATAARHEEGEPVERAAVCAGAGSSVLLGQPADLYVTGEMRHHDVLDCVAGGTSVILCDHTNTERGYLPTLRDALRTRVTNVEIAISGRDRDPLVVT